jgi:hypothetical protein
MNPYCSRRNTYDTYYKPATKKIIMQAKRSLLLAEIQLGAKKATKSLFQITMGSFDGAKHMS